ncbi:MAG: GNAT family N-acetyltransferase [Capsulimonadaceae bacterium]|nr:GNAT family N-acetyltransferase [Capsulimonadaceae bacterium]
MKTVFNEYEIDDDLARVDFCRVHDWLSHTYWTPGIELWKVKQAAEHSTLVAGVYKGSAQVAYARIVSDTIRFAYLADVYVDDAHRGRGIAQALVGFLQDHPLLELIPHITLKTLDAQPLYAKLGFEPLGDPEKWMRWKRDPEAC